MLFNSVSYMLFLPLAVLFYYVVPSRMQKIYLLVASYYFYACFDLRALPFLLVSTLVSFLSANIIQNQYNNLKKRRLYLILALIMNIGMLLLFKYFNFFAENMVYLANLLGISVKFKPFNILFITGISFFTFQSVGYVIDVYLNKIKAEKNLITYSLFIAFFPHILAGPISRGANLIPQLKEHKFSYTDSVVGLQLIAFGFFKKVAVADVLALFITAVHNNLREYSGLMLIFTAFAYSIQLYGDFSGYSDVARGSAKLLGIDIIDNFNTPYFSTSFSQFWTKWHISLSSWFQDYIFTPFVWTNPLRKIGFKNPPVIPAIWVVFLISGLWHGSAWTFVIWGVLHAIYRTGEDLMRKYYKKPDKHPKPLKFWSKVMWIFTLVTFSQIFFRANSVQDAFWYVANLFNNLSVSTFKENLYTAVSTGFDATPILVYGYIAFSVLVVAILVCMDWYRQFKLKGKCLTLAFVKMKQPYRIICYYILVALIMAGFIMNNGGYGSSASFIYANF